MANDPVPVAPQVKPGPSLSVLGSAAAPFIYFDSVSAPGHLHSVAQIELIATTLVPDGAGTKVEIVATAHLRCSISGLAALKDAIQKIELMLAPSDAKPN